MYKIITCFLIILFGYPLTLFSKEISLSFDDAPRGDSYYLTGKQRSKKLVENLKKANVKQVIFYSNTSNTTNDEKLERLHFYKSSGHLIGNHTATHKSASEESVRDFLSDFDKADTFLKKEKLLSPYFRFPYLKRGSSISDVRQIRSYILKKGYTDAYVTVDNFDWYMEALFQNSLKEKKEINFNNLKKFYVDTLMNSILFYDNLASLSLGKSPKHVLLLHENDLAALFIGDLVKKLKINGWKIVSPSKSYQDKFLIKYPDVLHHNQGRIASKSIELGYAGNIKSKWEDKATVKNLYKNYSIEK